MQVTPFDSPTAALRKVVDRLVADSAGAAGAAERDAMPDPGIMAAARDIGLFALDDLLTEVAAAEALGRLRSLGLVLVLLDQMFAATAGVDVSEPIAVARRQAAGSLRPLATGATAATRCLLVSDATVVGIGTADAIPAAALRGAGWGEISVDVEHTQPVHVDSRACSAAALREAAALVGTGWQAFDDAVEYAQQRTAFGRPIGRFQTNRHALATVATKLTAAQALVRDAAWLLVVQDREDTVPAAWQFAAAAVDETTDVCLQLHGGYGYTPAFDIERAWRDVRALRARGTPAHLRRSPA